LVCLLLCICRPTSLITFFSKTVLKFTKKEKFQEQKVIELKQENVNNVILNPDKALNIALKNMKKKTN